MFPFSSNREDRPWFCCLALLCLVHGALFFASSWFTSGGHFMLPLDDAYIHLQYAKQLARGAVLQYSPGADPSSGATSPLWVVLLAPVFVAGMSGVKGALAAFAFGVPLFALACIWMHQLATRLAGNRSAGIVASLLLAANGHAAWAFFSGMETGLFIVLLVGVTIGFAEWYAAESHKARNAALVMLALLPLARPEGALAIPPALILAFKRREGTVRIAPVFVALAIIPFVGWLAFLKVMTGDWRPAGLVLKGLTADPETGNWWAVQKAATSVAAIVTQFYDNQIPDASYAEFKRTVSMPFMPPMLGLLALLGGLWTLFAEWRSKRPGAASFLFVLWIIGNCSVANSRIPFIHNLRYLVPWTVLAMPLAVLGLRRLASLFQSHEDTAARVFATALVLASLPSVPFWWAEFGRNGRDMYQQHRRMTFALESLPKDSVLALTDTGILEYYTDLPHIDLMGLTSNQFTRLATQGEGAVFEALTNLPDGKRPTHIATYDSWWSSGMPRGEHLATTVLNDISIAGSTTMTLRTWNVKDFDGPTTDSRHVVWDLDVMDEESEKAAEYTYELPFEELQPGMWPTQNRLVRTYPGFDGEPLSEGVRWVTEEQFTVSAGKGDVGKEPTLCFLVSSGNFPDGVPWRESSHQLEITMGGREISPVELSPVQGDPGWLLGTIELSELAVEHIVVKSGDPQLPGWYSARIWVETASDP